MLMTASNMTGRDNLYTEDSIKALKKVIKAAETVFNNEDATQEEVNAQASALALAILDLKAAPSGNNNVTDRNANNNNNNNKITIITTTIIITLISKILPTVCILLPAVW